MTIVVDAVMAETRATFSRKGTSVAEGSHASWIGRLLVASCILGVIGGLTALGVWQLERRVWKLDLITRVEQRIHAAPVAAPGPAAWHTLAAAHDEYRRVAVSGHFLNECETFVQAVTEVGPGYWVLAEFRTGSGFTVLINRGFVPPERRGPFMHAIGPTTGQTNVTGLLRMSEPEGGFLRVNDLVYDRWYSRDVAAIAAARGLSKVAPYFIDAEAAEVPDAWPRGGLTVVTFPNNHLVYAMTWFGIAFMFFGTAVFARSERWPGRTTI